MVNIEEFTKRLNQVMEYYDLSAASFADKIEVGRSSISHLLSGRNKPSLDFVMKIVKTFPEVELYWLLNGKGSFPKQNVSGPKKELALKNEAQDLFSTPSPEVEKVESQDPFIPKKIQKIILLYTDGTFDTYEK